jgi:hypothetical protein
MFFSSYSCQFSKDEMEEAKNRIDNVTDKDQIKGLIDNLIEKVQQDLSFINSSSNQTINDTLSNQTVLNNTAKSLKNNNTTVGNTTVSNSKNDTSILGLLADLFRNDRHEKNPIENISKLNALNRSLKDLSASLSASK